MLIFTPRPLVRRTPVQRLPHPLRLCEFLPRPGIVVMHPSKRRYRKQPKDEEGDLTGHTHHGTPPLKAMQ
jgi:hypothetical protein